MDRYDQILAVKTRLTTIKGYAQLLERDLRQPSRHSRRSALRVSQLNREIDRLVALIAEYELELTSGEGLTPPIAANQGEGQASSGR